MKKFRCQSYNCDNKTRCSLVSKENSVFCFLHKRCKRHTSNIGILLNYDKNFVIELEDMLRFKRESVKYNDAFLSCNFSIRRTEVYFDTYLFTNSKSKYDLLKIRNNEKLVVSYIGRTFFSNELMVSLLNDDWFLNTADFKRKMNVSKILKEKPKKKEVNTDVICNYYPKSKLIMIMSSRFPMEIIYEILSFL